MSYTALYRKFRPSTFDQVKGQDHIVQTLKNQINANRIGHAYLFCGTRGTGKTSVAKIFAKAVNCEHPVNGDPCCQCPSKCRSRNRACIMMHSCRLYKVFRCRSKCTHLSSCCRRSYNIIFHHLSYANPFPCSLATTQILSLRSCGLSFV